MLDWNVVVTVREQSFRRAIKLLRRYGEVWETGQYNVLIMRVPDVVPFLEQVRRRSAPDHLFEVASHIMPVARRFRFAGAEDFARQASDIALEWTPRLARKSFHVRMHRRGLPGQLHSTRLEQALDRALLAALVQRGTPGRIEWADPDAILAIETIRNEAGLALWNRTDLVRYPFLVASIEPASARIASARGVGG